MSSKSFVIEGSRVSRSYMYFHVNFENSRPIQCFSYFNVTKSLYFFSKYCCHHHFFQIYEQHFKLSFFLPRLMTVLFFVLLIEFKRFKWNYITILNEYWDGYYKYFISAGGILLVLFWTSMSQMELRYVANIFISKPNFFSATWVKESESYTVSFEINGVKKIYFFISYNIKLEAGTI